jgi:hypothetical protein
MAGTPVNGADRFVGVFHKPAVNGGPNTADAEKKPVDGLPNIFPARPLTPVHVHYIVTRSRCPGAWAV